MDEVIVVGVCELLRRSVGDFGEDQRRERGSGRCGRGGMFREDGGVVCDARAGVVSWASVLMVMRGTY